MKRFSFLLLVAALAVAPAWFQQHPLVKAKDGSGVFGYKDTPIQPWSRFHVHDPDRPVPKRIDPGEASPQAQPGRPPSDAIVLFDGSNLAKWQPSKWKVEQGHVEVTEGSLVSQEEFGDCQLHVEWRAPDPPQGDVMNQGNSGVDVKIYPDGQAASVYGQTPPLVNACRKPGQWQAYDIIFFAPRFRDGKLAERARVTVLHNGVLVHHNQEIHGAVAHARLPAEYPAGKTQGPLRLGGHHNPVQFRNIWIRRL